MGAHSDLHHFMGVFPYAFYLLIKKKNNKTKGIILLVLDARSDKAGG